MASNLLCDPIEIQSLREWLAHWGDGPNWSDPKGETVPMAKATLGRLLDTAAYSWERFDEFKERDDPF